MSPMQATSAQNTVTVTYRAHYTLRRESRFNLMPSSGPSVAVGALCDFSTEPLSRAEAEQVLAIHEARPNFVSGYVGVGKL